MPPPQVKPVAESAAFAVTLSGYSPAFISKSTPSNARHSVEDFVLADCSFVAFSSAVFWSTALAAAILSPAASWLERSVADASCQKGISLPSHVPLTSERGAGVRSSRRSKLPWLDSGELSVRVPPEPHSTRAGGGAAGL